MASELRMAANPKTNVSCFECAKCCISHPCALEPDDISKIASYLKLTEEELFDRFLVLDYAEADGKKQYYVCPARKNDLPGTIVEGSWTFSDQPCTFLLDGKCSIQPVKPKGGRTYYCRLLANTGQDTIAYGKKRAVQDWSTNPTLETLFSIACNHNQHKQLLPVTFNMPSGGFPWLGRSENIYSSKIQVNSYET